MKFLHFFKAVFMNPAKVLQAIITVGEVAAQVKRTAKELKK